MQEPKALPGSCGVPVVAVTEAGGLVAGSSRVAVVTKYKFLFFNAEICVASVCRQSQQQRKAAVGDMLHAMIPGKRLDRGTNAPRGNTHDQDKNIKSSKKKRPGVTIESQGKKRTHGHFWIKSLFFYSGQTIDLGQGG